MRFKVKFAVVAILMGLWLPVIADQPEPDPAAQLDEAVQTDDPQQEDAPEAPAETPQETPPADTPAEPTPEDTQTEKSGFTNGLYVYVGYGQASSDPLNSSIRTSAENNSENMLNFDNMTVARAAVGWKLQHGKGDFRLVFDGLAEDGYTFSARGRALQAIIEGTGTVAEGLDWWQLDIADGVLHGRRDAPRWDQATDDLNDDGAVQQNEVTYLGDVPGNEFYLDYMRPTAKDLENRLQTIDLLYGRTWGGRRFSGRWWAGLRYFVYDGNVRAAAWLNTSQPGEGYSDGPLLRLLNFRQESSGLGPTGSMEANFNFFQKKLVLYIQASASFLLVDITADSGLFFTTLNTPTQPFLIIPIEARLQSERDKSTWQTAAEVGARWNIGGSGVELEAAYYIRGYLDAVLLPSTIQIPTTLGQAGQGTSAVYNTHDIRIDGWRFGVGFQF